MRRWPDWPPGPPRRVDGGLKARSTRGAIGESWWSRRFLAVLEDLTLGGRLSRGRSYARTGQVLALTVAPGAVTAVVQGSRAEPYRVYIGLAPYPERVWHQVERALADQALFSARLLAGEMPAEIEEVFDQASAPLFPTAARELDMSCSCPDWSVPCKHIAATFYLLAEAFDTEPFQILHWRGRSKEELLARLRELRSPAKPAGHPRATKASARRARGSAARAVAGDAPPAQPGAAIGTAAALGELPGASLESMVDRFWVPPVPLPQRPPTLEHGADLLLRQLPPPGPALGGPALTEHLSIVYERFATTRDGGDGADPVGGGRRKSGGRPGRRAAPPRL
jgi:uncharacterized Zn finger protein